MSHLLTGIPIGSSVKFLAMGRFPQEKITARTGAIRLVATRESYPIRVLVRPQAGPVQQILPGGRRGFKNYGPLEQALVPERAVGPSIDCDILGPDDFREDGTEPYLVTRHRRSDIRVVELQGISNSPSSDIYQRLFCAAGCGELVSEARATCAKCAPVIAPTCTSPKVTPSGITECSAAPFPPYSVCREHAVEQGLIGPVPAVPDASRCVWSGCASARFKDYVMCAEHAYNAGLIGPGVAIPAAAAPTKPVKATARPATGGSFGRHRADCACRICTGRRAKRAADTAAIVEAHDEHEALPVLSGVDAGEGEA